jgi:hypothetical protein
VLVKRFLSALFVVNLFVGSWTGKENWSRANRPIWELGIGSEVKEGNGSGISK